MSKKIGQWVFDLPDCPENATCAAVDADGVAYYYTEDPDDVEDLSSRWLGLKPGFRIPGSFDASDWQHSKIIREKKMDKMPELKVGDLLKDADEGYFWVLSSEYAYSIVPSNGGGLCVELVARMDIKALDIIEVYRYDETTLPCVSCLNMAISGTDTFSYRQIWKRPEVREMTVDQISKELGYTVKVVGQKGV